MIKKIKASYFWMKALKALEKENYSQLYNVLLKIDTKVVRKNYQYFLFKALSLAHMSESILALDALNKSRLLLKEYSRKKYDLDTYNYLLYYIDSLRKVLLESLGKNSSLLMVESNFNIEKVDRRILYKFPIEIEGIMP